MVSFHPGMVFGKKRRGDNYPDTGGFTDAIRISPMEFFCSPALVYRRFLISYITDTLVVYRRCSFSYFTDVRSV